MTEITVLHYQTASRRIPGRKGKTVVILLCAGDKSSQKTDIKTAKQYWKDYEKRTQDKKQT